MIFKKPYAFLIKYFRIINFIIALLASFIIYKSYLIVAFFRDYVNNSYTGTFYAGFYQDYVSPVVFFILILIILGLSFICLLFIHKKQKARSYTFCLIYYIVLLIYFIIIRNILIGMQEELISAEIARACRDISLIALVLQIPYCIFLFIRFFGFNIGKYNFKEYLKELEISEQDSEEVEITINQDSTKLKRNFRRFKREFLYYLKENKYIFLIIFIFSIGLIFFAIYKSFPNIIDQKFNQGDIFYINDLTYKVEDSIITNLNYNGEIIAKDKYYLVVKLYIENSGNNDMTIDYNNFRLELDNDKYAYPDKGKGDYFIDYAKNIFISNLKSGTKNTYSLVFEIDSQNIKKRYRLKIANGVAAMDDNIVGKFNYVTITPVIVNEVNQVGIFEQNQEISFINSNLGETTLQVSNPNITKKLVYDYKKCDNNNCVTYKDMLIVDYKNNDKTLLALDYKLNIDENAPFYTKSSNINKFINTFMKIKYVKNGREYLSNIKNVTPSNLTDKFAIEIPVESLDAEKLYISIIIRNKEYLINVK